MQRTMATSFPEGFPFSRRNEEAGADRRPRSQATPQAQSGVQGAAEARAEVALDGQGMRVPPETRQASVTMAHQPVSQPVPFFPTTMRERRRSPRQTLVAKATV